MMRPIKELKGFKKTLIKKGETVTVSFEIGFAELGFFMPNGEYVVEPGKFDIFIGENCLTDRKLTVEII